MSKQISAASAKRMGKMLNYNNGWEDFKSWTLRDMHHDKNYRRGWIDAQQGLSKSPSGKRPENIQHTFKELK